MKVMIMGKPVELMIGMDAEFFLRGPDGKYIAASSVIPGLKDKPHVLENGVCHPDGLSLEVGAPPSDTPDGMITNLLLVLEEVQSKYLTPKGVTIAYSHAVDHREVQGVQPDDLAFGCGVELAANTPDGGMLKQMLESTDSFNRYSGFHIHLGFTEGQSQNYFTYLDMRRLVLELDKLFNDSLLTPCPKRSRQYGGYGAFRVKPYGIEYRALDCRVITDKKRLELLLSKLQQLPDAFKSAGGK